MRAVLVSTGKPSSPTPIDSGKVRSKHPSLTMRGRGFVSPGVPWALCVSEDGTICLQWRSLAGAGRGAVRGGPQPRLREDSLPHTRWRFEHTPLGTAVMIQA